MFAIMLQGLIMGMLGSWHCAGMCGGLMLYHFSNNRNVFFRFLIYHSSRMLGYGLLGLMFGQLGFIGSLIGWQKLLSIISGMILIYLALSYFLPIGIDIFKNINFTSIISECFSFSSNRFYRYAVSGIANAFLPCGFSLMAAIYAMTTYSLQKGMLFMLSFGMGTIPALLLVTLLAQQVSYFKWFKYTMPVMSLIIGILLILRTMNLGIPFISPNIQMSKKSTVIECHLPNK